MGSINQQKKETIDKIREMKGNDSIFLVPNHFDLYAVLMEFKGKSFTRTEYYNSEKKESSINTHDEYLSSSTSKQVNNHFLQLERMRYTDGDYIKEQNRKITGKYRIASSSPDVSFTINPDGGYIDFNVSIPKYLFMHNSAQFVPQIDSKNYKRLDGNFFEWNVQRHYLYKRLVRFIERFFIDMYGFFKLDGLTPDYNYIEIRRIDLCYNQFFENKEDALTYLEHQKKIHKKSNLRYKQIDKDFETSIAFHTSKHEYFKIYHKGSEYKSTKYGDFAKHHKINKMAVKHYMRINEKINLEKHHEKFENKQYIYDIFNSAENIIFKKFKFLFFPSFPFFWLF